MQDMKKQYFFAIISLLLSSALLASIGLGIKDFMFWVLLISFTGFLYSIYTGLKD
jgi:hypothetical protein